MAPLVETTPRGLYCAAGNFYVDPWQPVERAVVTHAHSDHARAGSADYLTSADGVAVLRERVGADARIAPLPYGEFVSLNGVRISLHPAGHILGSVQVRIEHAGQVVVASGDYKLAPDATCRPFEPVRCHTFISESTFGLPIYRWRPTEEIYAEINAWWRTNQERGRTSVIFAYSLGKAQRVVAGLDASIGPILLHGAVDRFVRLYRAAGIELPETEYAGAANSAAGRGKAIVVAPPSAAATPWLRKFGQVSLAMASGWMQVRGMRRRRSVDRGFPLSDHADWPGLAAAIDASGASEVWVTHGYTGAMARWLSERGLAARAIATQYEGERDEEPAAVESAAAPADAAPADGGPIAVASAADTAPPADLTTEET